MKSCCCRSFLHCCSAITLAFSLFSTAHAQTPPATGACCLPSGTCEVRTRDACAGAGGIYRGDNTTCDGVTCTPRGACCLTGGGCVLVPHAICTALNGAYHGDGV